MPDTRDTEEAMNLLAELVRIDSSNPGLVPGSAGESRIADFTAEWLTGRGLTCVRVEPDAGRPSIVAIHRGSTDGGPSLMLNGHLDTVTLAGYEGDPLEPVVVGGRLSGRGAFDMKSGLAAIMLAAADLAAKSLDGDLIVTLVADEEHLSKGTEAVLAAGYRATTAIVVEPTQLEIVSSHLGYVWAEVTIHGVSAHGSLRSAGVDAIVRAGMFLTALGKLDDALSAEPPHPQLGTANVHASTIIGGEGWSSYPASCTIALEWRTLPGQDGASVRAALEGLLEQIGKQTPSFAYDVTIQFERGAFELSTPARVLDIVSDTILAVTGQTAQRTGRPFWTDCALLSEAGMPTLLFGPAGDGAHSAHEWADLESIEVTRRVLVDAATRLLNEHDGAHRSGGSLW